MFSKEAELQVMETVIVVIIIVMIILVGMGFFYKHLAVSIDNEEIAYKQRVFDNSIFTFPQQAEITCSKANIKESCLDAYKMIGFSETAAKKKDFYRGIYGARNITVEIIYPRPSQRKICTRQNANDCSTYVLYANKPTDAGYDIRTRTTPVSIYLPGSKQYAIGILTITGYKVGK